MESGSCAVDDLSDDEVIKAEISKIHEVLRRANPPVNCDWDDEDETDVFASESSDNYESDSDFAGGNSNYACAVVTRPDDISHSSFSDARAPSDLALEEDDVLIVDDNLSASDENCLHLNRLYQELLVENIAQLQQLLSVNRDKQNELQDSLDSKLRHGTTRTTYVTAANVFAIPYFKDVNGYHPPSNADTLAKSSSKERDPFIRASKSWVPADEKALIEAIELNAMQLAMQPVMTRKDELQEALSSETNEDEKARLAVRIVEKDVQLEKIKEMSTSELFDLNFEKNFDWLMISNTTFAGIRSAIDCQLYWQNCLNPCINRDEWKKEEIAKMKQLARRNEEHDWENIAEDLQTRRCGWQCFIKYQSDLGFLKKKFSPEDDEKLLCLVRNFATGSYIPWQQVCYHMDYFSKRQIRKRWIFYLDPRIKHGKWGLDEDLDLVTAVWKYGAANWRRYCLPGRTSKQCRARWMECLNPALSLEPFSIEEDKKLEDLVKQNPSAWTKILPFFKGRSCSMLKTRWDRIQGWRQKQMAKGIVSEAIAFPPSRERTNKRHKHRNLVYRKLAARLRMIGGLNQSSTLAITSSSSDTLKLPDQPKNEATIDTFMMKYARDPKRVRPRTKNNKRQEYRSDRSLNEMFWVCQLAGRYRANFGLDSDNIGESDELYVQVAEEIRKVMCMPCGSQEHVTNFLAPNVPTLTAFRNLLLIRGRLRNTTNPSLRGKSKNRDVGKENNRKRVKGCGDETEPSEPDYTSIEYHNLLANFCALFFWPAVFSGAVPKDDHLATKPTQTIGSKARPRNRERKRALKKPWVTERMKLRRQKTAETDHTQQEDMQRPIPEQGGSTEQTVENGVRSTCEDPANPPDSKRKRGRPLGSKSSRNKDVSTTVVRRSSRTKK